MWREPGQGGPGDASYADEASAAFSRWYHRVETVGSQPRWVTRTALAAAVLVVVVPLVLLTVAALVIGIVVFTVLAVIASGLAALRRLFHPGGGWGYDTGRRNVRVIRRD